MTHIAIHEQQSCEGSIVKSVRLYCVARLPLLLSTVGAAVLCAAQALLVTAYGRRSLLKAKVTAPLMTATATQDA